MARGPGPLLSAEPLTAPGDESGPLGVCCRFAEADLEVRFLADDIVRLTWGPGEPPIPWALAQPTADHRPSSVVEVTAGTPPATPVRAATPELSVEVTGEGWVSFRGRDDRLLRRELPPLRRGAARTARFELRPGERVAGLGEQASPVTLRGTTHRLWNRDPGGAWGPGDDPLYLCVPVLLGLHPDGDVLAFFENPHEATVRVDGAAPVAAQARVELTFRGGTDRHYVAAGTLPRLLERYSWLTGRPTLPPRWSLGFHQCRWGYRSQGEVRDVADGFAREGLPLSAVHLDIDHMDGYRVFTADPVRFGDLEGLCGDLEARGTRVVTIVDPAVKADESFEVFRQGRDDGRFLKDADGRPLLGVVWPGRAAFPDFTDPATREWWAGLYKGLLDAGVSGVWHDMNEPTSIALWGDRTLPPGTRHVAEGRGGDHRQCHNVYGLLMDRAGFEAQAAGRPDRRPWLLSRSGWAGLQRWAWCWTADVEATWEGLRQQVATTIGLGLSGIAYTGSDTGGFNGAPGPELFLRWLELAVLMPFCRTHSVTGAPPREPWRWPEPYRTAVGRLVRFRYRLLPYLYTLAHEASRTGHPFVRPLSWPDGRGPAPAGADDRLWSSDDAYLLGDALLVAPATREGCGARPVPLPAGEWFRWRALPPMEGGTGPGSTRWSGWSGHRRSSSTRRPASRWCWCGRAPCCPSTTGGPPTGPPTTGGWPPATAPGGPPSTASPRPGEWRPAAPTTTPATATAPAGSTGSTWPPAPRGRCCAGGATAPTPRPGGCGWWSTGCPPPGRWPTGSRWRRPCGVTTGARRRRRSTAGPSTSFASSSRGLRSRRAGRW